MTFGFVKRIWNNSDTAMSDSASKKQAILDSLFHHCQTRIYTSKDVLVKLLSDLQIVPPTNSEEKLLEIIREYKNTGKNLEATIDALYSILYAATSDNGVSNDYD